MDFNNDVWRQQRVTESGIRVLVTGDGMNLKAAYFKNLSRRAGPSIFNEYIAYKLGVILDYPIPKIEFLNFGDELGIISHNVPLTEPFQALISKDDIISLIENANIFSKSVVFDFWVRNVDRHDKNLIVQNTALNKYRVYMVDHELSLFGQDNNPPASLVDFPFGELIKIPKMKSLIPNQDSLIKEAETIEGIADETIKQLLLDLRSNFNSQFTEIHSKTIEDLLIQRKSLCKNKSLEWYNT